MATKQHTDESLLTHFYFQVMDKDYEALRNAIAAGVTREDIMSGYQGGRISRDPKNPSLISILMTWDPNQRPQKFYDFLRLGRVKELIMGEPIMGSLDIVPARN